MFDGLPHEDSFELSVPIPLDDKGYLDRRCPKEVCNAQFKVHYDDWIALVQDEAAYCPICGHTQVAQDFSTPEQAQYIADAAMQHLMGMIDDAMEEMARSFNARQQKGLVSLSMSYERGAPPIVVPSEATELLRQDIVCEKCVCHFATTGAAYFCPACHHNSGALEYRSNIENIENILNGLKVLVGAMEKQSNTDAAENLKRSLLENSLEDLATILQRRTETLFSLLPNEGDFSRDDNLFQRLDDASKLWKESTGTGYEDVLSTQELQGLNTMMQQRHKVGHKLGHIDQKYIDKSGDTSYQLGQRLVISSSKVGSHLAAIKKLIVALESLVNTAMLESS